MFHSLALKNLQRYITDFHLIDKQCVYRISPKEVAVDYSVSKILKHTYEEQKYLNHDLEFIEYIYAG